MFSLYIVFVTMMIGVQQKTIYGGVGWSVLISMTVGATVGSVRTLRRDLLAQPVGAVIIWAAGL